MSTPIPAPENSAKRSRNLFRLSSLSSLLIVVFATCHAMKMLMAVLPEANQPDLMPLGLGYAYEKLTGSQQNWNMFVTIPVHHAYRARIVITGTEGAERELGPLLPGFKPYPTPEQTRIYHLFDRMFTGTGAEGLRNAYLAKVDHKLRDERRIRVGEKWHLEVAEDFTRHLTHVKRDGRLFERRLQRFSYPTPTTPPGQSTNP